jgi:hypothetical protein
MTGGKVTASEADSLLMEMREKPPLPYGVGGMGDDITTADLALFQRSHEEPPKRTD